MRLDQALPAAATATFSAKSFGATGNGVTDDSAALQTALTAAAGQTLLVPKGTYAVSAALVIAAGTTIVFDNATILSTATVAAGVFTFSAADITITGKVFYNAQLHATPCFVGTLGGDRFDAGQIHASITNAATAPSANNYLFKITQCNGVKIGGYITTSGNSPWLVRVDRGSNIDIANVYTPPLTVTNGSFGVVMAQETTGAGAMSNINIHDCNIDGGGVLAGPYGAIVVGTATTAITCKQITISNCIVANTASLCDGIDVVLAQYVTVVNCVLVGCTEGVNVSGCTAVTVTDTVAILCRAFGFSAGDPTVTFATNAVTFSNCQAFGCGQGGVGSAQFLVYAPVGVSTNVVHFEGCTAFAEANSQFELAITGGGGTVFDVFVNGGLWLGGTVGHILDNVGALNAAAFRVKNAYQWNPHGNLGASTPAVPATTVALVNGTGYDCEVFINGGTVSAVAIGGVATGIAATGRNVRVPHGQSITLTYTVAPTWVWFAD